MALPISIPRFHRYVNTTLVETYLWQLITNGLSMDDALVGVGSHYPILPQNTRSPREKQHFVNNAKKIVSKFH